MFVLSKRNIVLPGPNGERFKMDKDFMGPIPVWAENSGYLAALVRDGKVILSTQGTDKDFAAKERNRKSKKPAKEAAGVPKEGAEEKDQTDFASDRQPDGVQEEEP